VKSILIIAILAAASFSQADQVYDCAVAKYPKGQGMNLSDDTSLIFKGPVSGDQMILVDTAANTVKIAKMGRTDITATTKVYNIINIFGLVLLTDADTQTASGGKDASVIMDYKNNMIVSCSAK
jgi:hypothetical protein